MSNTSRVLVVVGSLLAIAGITIYVYPYFRVLGKRKISTGNMDVYIDDSL